MSYYEISFPCLAENLCHIKLPRQFHENSSSYLVSHYFRSTSGEDDEEAANNEIRNLTDILEKHGVPYELSNRGIAENVRSNFRTFFYPDFLKGRNGTLKMTVDYYDFESNPSSIENEAKKYVEENRRGDGRPRKRTHHEFLRRGRVYRKAARAILREVGDRNQENLRLHQDDRKNLKRRARHADETRTSQDVRC